MKTLILLRGLPGAGKSTMAKMLVGNKEYRHKEADMYFIDREGNYKFDASKIKDAHKWCQEEVEWLMGIEQSPVVVSNTFAQEWEMEPYYQMAKKYGYVVHSVIVENRHNGENTHGVPADKLTQMEDRFEIKLK